MGGYNSVSEILSFGKRALIVPRVSPRKEQFLRAARLKKMGVLDMLHPDNLTPHRLSDWLLKQAGLPQPGFRDRIDLNGLERIQKRFDAIMNYTDYTLCDDTFQLAVS